MNFPDFVFLAQSTGPAQPSLLGSLAPILLLIPIFYFIIIRPQQKRHKELQALISKVKTGDKVITSGGLHGIVANVKEKTFLLKVADNVKLEFDKTVIATVESDPAS